MTPLADLPAGNVRRNGRPYLSKEQFRKQVPSAASSMQTMLKFETCVEHTPEKVSKTHHKPLPASEEASIRYNGSFMGHKSQHVKENHSNFPSMRSSKPKSHTKSLASYRSEPLPLQNYVSISECEASFPLRQWQMEPRRLSRHPNQTVNYYSRWMTPNGRPRSPFAYPTRLKRVGYRPSSPAWSDINQAVHPSFTFPRGHSPSSLGPIYTMAGPMQQQIESVRSAATQYHLHPMQANARQCQGSVGSMILPDTRAFRNNEHTMAKHQEIQPALPRPILHQETESLQLSPSFYDYSEAFLDLPSSEKTPPLAVLYPHHPEIPQNVHLKTDTADLISKDEIAFKTPNGMTVSTPLLRRTKSLPCPILNGMWINSRSKVERQSFAYFPVSVRKPGEHVSAFQNAAKSLRNFWDPTEALLLEDRIDLPNEPKVGKMREHSEPFIFLAKTSPGPTTSVCSRSSTTEALKQSHEVESKASKCQVKHCSNTSSTSFRSSESHNSFAFDDACTQVTVTNQIPPTEGASLSEGTEIVSPTPERSLLSTCNQHRFSKILGLSEDSLLTEITLGIEDTNRNTHPKEEAQLPMAESKLQNLPQAKADEGERCCEKKKSLTAHTGTGSEAPQGLRHTTEASEPYLSHEQISCPSKNRIVVAVPPPSLSPDSEFPFLFTPIKQNNTTDSAVSSMKLEEAEQEHEPTRTWLSSGTMRLSIENSKIKRQESLASSRGSRPWNRDSNYPWNDKSLNLDVVLRPGKPSTTSPVNRIPRFKLRIQRASNSSTGTGFQTKSSEGQSSPRPNSGQNFLHSSLLKRKSRQTSGNGPDEVNNCHRLADDTPSRRFTGSSSGQELDEMGVPPTLQICAPAPTQAQSYFSDDSSQKNSKGHLRMRLSAFKPRHFQSGSVEGVPMLERRLLKYPLGNSRASGCTSRQSGGTAGTRSQRSSYRRHQKSLFQKLKVLWRRSGDRLHSRNKAKHQTPTSLAPVNGDPCV